MSYINLWYPCDSFLYVTFCKYFQAHTDLNEEKENVGEDLDGKEGVYLRQSLFSCCIFGFMFDNFVYK